VGLYTSPQLHEYTERIQVNRALIPKMELVRLVNQIKPIIANIPRLTTFEITTALAFQYFFEQNVDVAVIEVGLGGRLDATNVVIPIVSVITSISLDHTAVLGSTLSAIAYEKAGIIKSGRPVVIAPQDEEALNVFKNAAKTRNSELIEVEEEYSFKPGERSLDGQYFSIQRRMKGINDESKTMNPSIDEEKQYFIPLLGNHQIENAATAFAALKEASKNGVLVTDTGIDSGFKNTHWSGRFEVFRKTPPIIIDCAHNRDSARRLRQTFDDYFPRMPLILLIGASEDKDIDGILAELLPRCKEVVFTRSIHPRALEPEKMKEKAQNYNIFKQVIQPLENALEYVIQSAGGDSGILITGSIFIAAAALELLPTIIPKNVSTDTEFSPDKEERTT